MLPQTILRGIERFAQKHQGKGWGSFTVDQEAAAAAKLLAPTSVVIDVGGNVGDWSAAILDRVDVKRLVVVEPDAGNCVKLRDRFKDGRVEVVQLALSSSNGTAELYSNHLGSGLASLHKRELHHQKIEHEMVATVETISLERLLETRQIETVDLLKMDIEGHEFTVLQAAEKLLPRVRMIQFEFGGPNVASKTFFLDFWRLLSPAYSIWRLGPSGLIDVSKYRDSDEALFGVTNYLAIRR
ncbi:FkbM family methyltransferase [Devosia sp. LjRoot16]|uniref:FkbM family methyltransferase n=1 Tax=Devosia sp. LjRoot16 TaxID=3342271 RepID=UPI003ED11320